MSLLAGRHIAVLGAPGMGTAPLADALRQALPGHHITEQLYTAQPPDLALVLGLDLSDKTVLSPDEHATLERSDTAIRQQLLTMSVPYRVVYGGTASERLNQALLALGLSPTDPASRTAREQAQYQLNRGRTPWSCDTCSDPDCEHRLFTGLIKRPEL